MSVQLYLSVTCIAVIVITVFAFLEIHKTSKEINKMDIELSDMCKMEKTIASFYEKNKLKSETSLEEIAEILKVTWGDSSESMQSQAALSDPDENGIRKVIFKEGLSGETKRFVFAHECAHLINGDMDPLTRPLGKNKPKIEQLADYTAAALLMPLNQIYQYLEVNNYQSTSKRRKIELVRELCKTYKVSEIIAVRRIKEVYAVQRNLF